MLHVMTMFTYIQKTRFSFVKRIGNEKVDVQMPRNRLSPISDVMLLFF